MIGNKVSRSASRMAAAQLVARSFDFIGLLVVARLLTPGDFGLVTMASSVLLVANSLTELPVSDALVQRHELDERLLASAFALTVMRGLLVAGVLWGVSAPLAQWLDEPRLALVLRVMSLAPLAQGVVSPAMVYYLRDVNYSPLARSQLFGKFVSFVAIVALAWWTRSYWALIAGLIANPIATAVATYFVAPWRPRFGLTGVSSLISFTGWVTLSRMITALNIQTDRFFVGKFLGKTSVGFYSMAGDISSLATYAVAAPVMQPLFAGFSRLRSEPQRLAEAYLKGQQIMVTLIAPLGFGLGAVAHTLVPLVFGQHWTPIIPLVSWLAPTAALQLMVVPVQALAMARGQTRYLAIRELFALMVRLPATLAAAWYYGLLAAVIVRCVTSLLYVAVSLSLASNMTKIGIFRQILSCGRALFSALTMASTVFLLQEFFPAPEHILLQFVYLAGCIILGATIYISVLLGLWQIAGRPAGAESWILLQISNRLGRVKVSG